MTSSVATADAAAVLREARRRRRTVDPFTDRDPALSEPWGYAVQALDRDERLGRGEVLVGAKLGLTSQAKQQRMKVAQPVGGFLTDAMLVAPDRLPEAARDWIHPRIEPEIAFVLGRPVDRALTRAEAAACVESVSVAAEVIDSRYTDFRFRLADVLADNTSAAGVLLGERVPAASVPDLASLPCRLEVDGEVVHSATGAAILGDPLEALVWLSEHVARQGEVVPAGHVVLAGALTDAVPLVPGSDYRITIDGLGTIAARA